MERHKVNTQTGVHQFAKETTEFHVVILGHEDSGALYPLTDEMPLCLLPVAGRPFLFYQLESFRAAGISDVTLLIQDIFKPAVSRYLTEYQQGLPPMPNGKRANIHLVPAVQGVGSAQALALIKDRTCSNFVVVPDDLLVGEQLIDLLDQHRVSGSDCTVALRRPVEPEPGKKAKKKKEDEIDEETEVIGLTASGRLALKAPLLEMEAKGLQLSKFLLGRNSRITISTELVDPHLYVLSKWMLAYILDQSWMIDLQHDLIPHLVQKQFMPLDIDFVEKYSIGRENKLEPEGDEEKYEVLNPIYVGTIMFPSSCLCHRADTIQSYGNLNKEIVGCPRTALFGSLHGLKKRDQSVIGKECQLGQKVNIKGSVLGERCVVGDKAKINNCIIMENVQIGQNCTIQNCVVSSSAVIEDDCNLNECQIGMLTHIESGTKAKGEQFTRQT